jgi:transcriptional regulator with XRE-family HTH domain
MKKYINPTPRPIITTEDIALYCRYKRKKENMTSKEMAKTLEISSPMVTGIENVRRKKMREDTIDRYLEKWGITRKEFANKLKTLEQDYIDACQKEEDEIVKVRRFLKHRSEMPDRSQGSVAIELGASKVYVHGLIHQKKGAAPQKAETRQKILDAFKLKAVELPYLNELDSFNRQDVTPEEKQKIKRALSL